MIYVAKAGQSFDEICYDIYGDYTNVVELISSNCAYSDMETLEGGEVIKVNEPPIENPNIYMVEKWL